MMTTVDNRLQTLWDGCLRNDRKQQEMLYKVLAPKMLAVCLRYAKDKDEAQDILQEGFIKIFKNMGNYRGEGSLEGWIRRIMVHSAISRYRKARNVVLVEDFAEQGIPVSTSYNDNGLEARDLMNMVQQLPDTYRSVFNMYAIEGFSHQEIGSKLGMSELLSRTTLHRARTILKEKLTSLAVRERHCLAG
ncbi:MULTISPECIES: RNA polymerase sigma factor [unclassified Mucilaginibacter]|uniref:RNA polymerase sigma factor n=1 Tax=unclassified Mucilaginibacter TaxID=2617802 RepID=UPI002AC9AFD6|nr:MULTISPECIES: RNA polymerase sigma factor [unclassified Mucilaginibacter]MEB0248881.1 RNA polymerase sigma factor [Mucilaginibacter sp. 5B2]MEB0262139.1 RNA polymerase sigma factor [Mucilaginibacter sp. 10I4]MEB0279800.1 RNA polymerase sigma factor [Mucilaginibacter sp. 10B2]MEB0301248.1 RNA polymerase sigma factor [Mucilaginibacter sp. 5C4]WPX24228.1 RNA polymerase sigma factor [Mucilaginibacter sp. 5C4]